MRMRAKPHAWRNAILVYHAKAAKSHVLGVMVIGEGKSMA
jgi:hypothetical protein